MPAMHIYVEILKYLYLFLGLLFTATMFCQYVPDDAEVVSVELINLAGTDIPILPIVTYKEGKGKTSQKSEQDKYHAERTKEYEKEQAELKQKEEEQRLCYEEEQAKIAAEMKELALEKEAIEKKLQEEKAEAEAIRAKHKQLVDEKAKDEGGPYFDVLAENYEKTLRNPTDWSSTNFDDCTKDIIAKEDQDSRDMNALSNRAINEIRQDWDDKESAFEKAHNKRMQQIRSEVFEKQSLFSQKIKDASDQDEKLRLKEELDTCLRSLSEEKKKISEEYEKTTDNWSQQKRKDFDKDTEPHVPALAP